jgi:hypothetical protein
MNNIQRGILIGRKMTKNRMMSTKKKMMIDDEDKEGEEEGFGDEE